MIDPFIEALDPSAATKLALFERQTIAGDAARHTAGLLREKNDPGALDLVIDRGYRAPKKRWFGSSKVDQLDNVVGWLLPYSVQLQGSNSRNLYLLASGELAIESRSATRSETRPPLELFPAQSIQDAVTASEIVSDLMTVLLANEIDPFLIHMRLPKWWC